MPAASGEGFRPDSAVEAFGLDDFGHRRGDEMAEGEAGFGAGPDFGGREGQGEAPEEVESETVGRRGGFDPGSGDDDEIDQFGEAPGFPPSRKGSHVVGADEPGQSRSWEPAGIFCRGIDAIRNAAAADFLVVDLDAVHSGEGESEHAKAQAGGGRSAGGLEGRLGGGNDDESVQLEFLEGGLRHEQVPQVDGIEGSSVKADAVHAWRLRVPPGGVAR